MAEATLEQAPVREVAPDTRGPSSLQSLAILWMGIAAIGLVLGGLILVQAGYALRGPTITPACTELQLTPDDIGPGAGGVCNIVTALRSSVQTALFAMGIALGVVATGAGLLRYRRMDNRRRREHAVTGAILGVQAVVLAAMLIYFREGRPDLFAKHFLNFQEIQEYFPGSFLNAMKNTIVLAFAGELGGVVLGLVLAMMTLSNRRAARAPARAYINFFRGTPLIWQIATASALFLFGFEMRLSPFVIAILVFALNTAAYAAEVFRAGIQSIERGQMEAARSLGMSYFQAMRYSIVPQAVRRVIPPLMNEFVILIKDTSLVIVLGLFESQYELFTWARQGQADTFSATFFTAAALGYLAVTLPLIRLVNAVEARLRSGLVSIAGGAV